MKGLTCIGCQNKVEGKDGCKYSVGNGQIPFCGFCEREFPRGCEECRAVNASTICKFVVGNDAKLEDGSEWLKRMGVRL